MIRQQCTTGSLASPSQAADKFSQRTRRHRLDACPVHREHRRDYSLGLARINRHLGHFSLLSDEATRLAAWRFHRRCLSAYPAAVVCSSARSIKCGKKTGRRHITIPTMTTATRLSMPSARKLISLVNKSTTIGAAYPTTSISLIMASPSSGWRTTGMLPSNLRSATCPMSRSTPEKVAKCLRIERTAARDRTERSLCHRVDFILMKELTSDILF